MKLGISTWVWTSPATTPVLDRLIPHVAELGFEAVELPIETLGQFDVAHARALADAHGLGVCTCAVIGPGRDLLLEEERAAGEDYVRGCIDAAAVLGSPAVCGPLYSAVGRCWRATPDARARDLDVLAGVLRRLGDYAATRGVALGIEPLNRFETSFLNTTDQALELLRRVDHPAVGLSLDAFHLGIEEKSLGEAIRKAGPHLRHVQVADNDRGTPGTGHLPWDDLAAALGDVGYDGYVIIETFSDDVEAIARAASIWRPLAPSPDALAREGLAFLKKLFRTPAGRGAA